MRRLTLLLLMIAFCFSTTVYAQGTAADYERANGLKAKYEAVYESIIAMNGTKHSQTEHEGYCETSALNSISSPRVNGISSASNHSMARLSNDRCSKRFHSS